MPRKLLQAVLLAALSVLLAAGAARLGWLDGWENTTWTWRVRALAKPSPSTGHIKIVFIDQASLDWAAKENALSWPWPRQVYAPIIDFLRRGGARTIAFDMLYSEPSAYPEDDGLLGEAIGRSNDFVAAFFTGQQAAQTDRWPDAVPRPRVRLLGDMPAWVAGLTEPRATFPVPEVAGHAALLASVKDEPDQDGVYRRLTPLRFFDGQPLPALGLAAHLLTAGTAISTTMTVRAGALHLGSLQVPLDRWGRAIPRFRGPSGTHQGLSAAAVIQSEMQLQEGKQPNLDPAVFRGAYVFFGVSAPALKDLKSTPVSGDYPGVELHATFLDNLLEQDFLRELPLAVAYPVALLLALLAALLVLCSSKAWQSAVVFLVFLPLPLAFGFGAYAAGWWWPVVFTESSLALALVSAMLLSYATEGKQKRFIKSAFKQYLSGEFIDRMLEHPDQLKLGGEKRELTMFFSDLKGFSSISEKLDAGELTSLMNDYLSDMCDIILEEGGTVDKFIGDAIVAFWNAPVPQEDHALRAVRTALRCQLKLAERREEFRHRAGGIPLYMRIGINTGEVIVGNMGSRQRFNYTMLGDAANAASRLEGANKPFGTYIMVSESTWKRLGGQVPGRIIADLRVVGRATPLRVYEPLGLPGAHLPAKYELHDRAMQLVTEKKWREASDLFQDIANDPLATLYAERCNALRDGTLKDWDGIWNLTEK